MIEVQPLPQTTMSKILGLCEALDDRGGKDDIYKLARDLQIKFGDLILTIKAGEMMKFFNTPGADVTLEPMGKKVIEVKMNEKKALVREQVKNLGIFQYFIQFLKNQPDREVNKEIILEEITRLLPSENTTQTFNTLINWGRYGEIFNYNRDTNKFSFDADFLPPDNPAPAN